MWRWIDRETIDLKIPCTIKHDGLNLGKIPIRKNTPIIFSLGFRIRMSIIKFLEKQKCRRAKFRGSLEFCRLGWYSSKAHWTLGRGPLHFPIFQCKVGCPLLSSDPLNHQPGILLCQQNLLESILNWCKHSFLL